MVEPQTKEEKLEERVASLEFLADQLRQQLRTEHKSMVGEFTRIEELVGSVTDSGKVGAPISGFRVGETTLRIGGYVDFDLHGTAFDDGAVAASSPLRDFYVPGAVPVGGDRTTAADMTAQATRFSATATRGFGDERAVAYLEADYMVSAQGNERVSSSFAQRLRRAYVDYRGWRIGQEWTTFQDLTVIPESASFLVLSEGMVFNRQAMIRYTRGPWQFAAENGNATITATDGSRLEADSNVLPDLVARYNMDGDFGHASISGIARQLRSENGTADDEIYGFGLALQGRLKVGQRDDVRFSVVGGEGIGRYVALNATDAAMVNPVGGDLEAVNLVGGLVAWRHPLGETMRLNIGASSLLIDNPDFAGAASTKSIQSFYSAFLWDIAPKITAGVELLHGIRETEGGDTGEITRGTFSVQYGF